MPPENDGVTVAPRTDPNPMINGWKKSTVDQHPSCYTSCIPEAAAGVQLAYNRSGQSWRTFSAMNPTYAGCEAWVDKTNHADAFTPGKATCP